MPSKKKKRNRPRTRSQTTLVTPTPTTNPAALRPDDPSQLPVLPATYQSVSEYFSKLGAANPFALRKETFLRIERITGTPLVCYVTKTHHLAAGIPASIDDSDLTGFEDLIRAVIGDAVDVFIVSNGGVAEATERIVRLFRDHFKRIRFVVANNAYSAATLMCFSGDTIIMGPLATLGPIDPQVRGIPARAILRSFESIEQRLKAEGPRALTAYLPLILKYDLHDLEICKSAEDLSRELATKWLSRYMLKCDETDPRVSDAVGFFADYDLHKSHGRGIDRAKARELGLAITYTEEIQGLDNLVLSLRNQYELWFDKTHFYKVFEDARGTNWGRQAPSVTIQLPPGFPPAIPQPVPQPGPPQRSG